MFAKEKVTDMAKYVYGKTVNELFYEFKTNLVKGKTFTRKYVLSWFNAKYPKIKEGTVTAHLSKMSVNSPSRIDYGVKRDGYCDLFFKIDKSNFRLYEKGFDPPPFY